MAKSATEKGLRWRALPTEPQRELLKSTVNRGRRARSGSRSRIGLRLRRLPRLGRLYLLRAELRLAPTDTQRLFLLTILPLMIANMTAFVLARRFRSQSIYEALLEQDGLGGDALPAETSDDLRIGALLEPHLGLTLAPEMPAPVVVAVCGSQGAGHSYPVVEASGRLLGVVTAEGLGIIASSPELEFVATASDVMRPAVSVEVDDDLATALEKMLETGVRELPVTDPDGRLLGMIDDKDVANAYRSKRQGSV